MADKANLKFIVLWEDEVRAAARLLRQMNELRESADDEVYNTAATAALNACLVALWGVTDEDALVMVASSAIKRICVSEPDGT